MTDLRQAAQAALENLEAVLCDPEGRAGIHGSDGDLKIIDEALDGLRAALAAQPLMQQWESRNENSNRCSRFLVGTGNHCHRCHLLGWRVFPMGLQEGAKMTDLRQAAQAVVSAWKAGELGLGIKEFSALEATLAAQQAAQPVAKQLSREQIGDIVREHLRGLYYCGRVWEAWSVGTMSEDDFSPAEELETADEIADSLWAGMTQASWDAPPQQAAADHPAYQLGFADGAAQYAHKTRGQIREQAAEPVAPVPMPGGIRLTVVERCELIDWRDKCVDDAVSRTLAAAPSWPGSCGACRARCAARYWITSSAGRDSLSLKERLNGLADHLRHRTARGVVDAWGDLEMTTDDIMALSEGCATPTPLRAVVAELVAERDALKAENLRLAGEIASRNQRALDGDQCKASWDELYDRAEAFRVERDALLEWKAAANGAGIQQEQELMRVETERDALRAALAAQPQQATSCTDPHCPCRDGDACHYKDAADGTKAWAAQPVAALMRSRYLRTRASIAHDGQDHFSDWGQWLPTTIEHAKAVTDPSRNTNPKLYEMVPLFAAAQPQQAADELGWLIEMQFGDGLLWWSGCFDDDGTYPPSRLIARMVNDVNKAVRFSRREDAQRVLDAMLAAQPCPLLARAKTLYSVHEHMWPEAAQPQQAEGDTP